MPYRPTNREIQSLLAEIDAQLKRVNTEFVGSDLRSKVRHLVEIQRRFSDLGVTVAHSHGIKARAARERILAYLVMYVGVAIEGEELQIVSGIAEFARRIRELRVEQGYQIASGASPDIETGIELRPDQYQLVDAQPDADAPRRWHVANRIRRSGMSGQDCILEFFKENVGQVVTTEELAYVAREARQYARRARQLRTEQGYLIATQFTGRPDLRMGQYVLEPIPKPQSCLCVYINYAQTHTRTTGLVDRTNT